MSLHQRSVCRIHGEQANALNHPGWRIRLRHLESKYPAVAVWEISCIDDRIQGTAHDARMQARVVATLFGGRCLEALAFGIDGSAAVRSALAALELKLDSESSGARDRAARWLTTVKRHWMDSAARDQQIG